MNSKVVAGKISEGGEEIEPLRKGEGKQCGGRKEEDDKEKNKLKVKC